MNNAVADAARYLKAFETLQANPSTRLEDAIDEYDDEVVTRGQKEVDVSYRQSLISHQFEEYARQVSRGLLNLLPSSKSANEGKASWIAAQQA